MGAETRRRTAECTGAGRRPRARNLTGVVQRPPAGTIPDAPGSYQFKDAEGRVIYVGKAASLRQRLSNYFGAPSTMHPRTAQMVTSAATVEWIQVRNEVEALMLEYSLIKQHRPRFNIRLRDDKSYPFLAITLDEEWPRALVMRGRKRKGVRYFGPYGHAYAIRDTLDLLLRTFPIRTCSPSKFRTHERLGRPCLLFHIEKCSGPCVGEVDKAALRRARPGAASTSSTATPTASCGSSRREMKGAAGELEFERAARLRDRLTAVNKAIERQQMVADRNEDIDVIGLADDDLEAAVQMFYVRKGRVVGRKGFIVDKVEDLTPAGLVARILEELYGEEPPLGVPKQVLVPVEPESVAVYEEWLCELRGSRVQVRVPQRGEKRELQETVTRNAKEEFTRHRLRRASDHNSRARALNELQDALELPEAPLRIECYDMAHIQGTDYVGSMVVLEDGLPRKSEYRRFKVQRRRGQRRLRGHGGGAHPPARRLPGGAGPAGERATRQVRLPAAAPAGRRRQGPAGGGRAGRAGARARRRDPAGVVGQALRGGLRAGPVRAGADPAVVRGALPAAAGARRGPPLRQLVPPRAAGQADDQERPRRRAGTGPDRASSVC